eukprot:TRINITY_DN12458_c0_g1_i3.p1 TRINITY_DN12458_c0_g1~~TRINITY_DN12458_c0_g1_i3.p1  ORF type:complete len:593 (-),score=92.88 TRINITY_DN12458_c0_g1_i3:95-1873(-)
MPDSELVSSRQGAMQDSSKTTPALKRYVYRMARAKLNKLHELERQQSRSESKAQVKSRPLTLLMMAADAMQSSIHEGKQAQNFISGVQELQASHVPEQPKQPEEPEYEKGEMKWEGGLYREAKSISHRLSLLRQMDLTPYMQSLRYLEDLKSKLNDTRAAAVTDLSDAEELSRMCSASLGLADRTRAQVELAKENLTVAALGIIADAADASVNKMNTKYSLDETPEEAASELSEEDFTDAHVPEEALAVRQSKVMKSNALGGRASNSPRTRIEIGSKITGHQRKTTERSNRNVSHRRADALESLSFQVDGKQGGLVCMPKAVQKTDAMLPTSRSHKTGNRMSEEIRYMLEVPPKGSPRRESDQLRESGQPLNTNVRASLDTSAVHRESAELTSKLEDLLTTSVAEVAEIMGDVGRKSGEVLKSSDPFGKQINGLLESVKLDDAHIHELLSAAEGGETDFHAVCKRGVRKLNAMAGIQSVNLASRTKVRESLAAAGWQPLDLQADHGVPLSVLHMPPAQVAKQPQALLMTPRLPTKVVKLSPFVRNGNANYHAVEPARQMAQLDAAIPKWDPVSGFPSAQRRGNRAIHQTRFR